MPNLALSNLVLSSKDEGEGPRRVIWLIDTSSHASLCSSSWARSTFSFLRSSARAALGACNHIILPSLSSSSHLSSRLWTFGTSSTQPCTIDTFSLDCWSEICSDCSYDLTTSSCLFAEFTLATNFSITANCCENFWSIWVTTLSFSGLVMEPEPVQFTSCFGNQVVVCATPYILTTAAFPRRGRLFTV